jgi:hypothetical protein
MQRLVTRCLRLIMTENHSDPKGPDFNIFQFSSVIVVILLDIILVWLVYIPSKDKETPLTPLKGMEALAVDVVPDLISLSVLYVISYFLLRGYQTLKLEQEFNAVFRKITNSVADKMAVKMVEKLAKSNLTQTAPVAEVQIEDVRTKEELVSRSEAVFKLLKKLIIAAEKDTIQYTELVPLADAGILTLEEIQYLKTQL